jgi:hypothetical protein
MRKFYAKSRAVGQCRTCRRDIPKGSPTWWAQGRGFVCTACKPAPSPGDEAPQPNTGEPATGKLPPARLTETKPGVFNLEFDRLIDAAQSAVANNTGRCSNPAKVDERLQAVSGTTFLSCMTPEQLIDKLQHGDAEMVAMVDDFRQQISDDIAMPSQPRRKVRRGCEFGDEIQVERYLDKVPEMWNRMERQSAPTSRVVVLINGTVSCGQQQSELGYRAAAAIALADRLTEMGASVEIRIMHSVDGGPTKDCRRAVISATVKQSDQPMSIPDMATGCCLIGAYRLAMVYGAARHFPGEVTRGFGTAADLPKSHREGADFIVERDVDDRHSALKWVEQAIAQYRNDQTEGQP